MMYMYVAKVKKQEMFPLSRGGLDGLSVSGE
jgi:hypothetical protein